jgi:hypothetical protein
LVENSALFFLAAGRSLQKVFEEDVLIAGGKPGVALAASNLAAVPAGWELIVTILYLLLSSDS